VVVAAGDAQGEGVRDRDVEGVVGDDLVVGAVGDVADVFEAGDGRLIGGDDDGPSGGVLAE